ncbi:MULTISPECIES: hypothetical protein [Flavobacterium]|nr:MULTISPECIES: hypothetical protein [Flavobacterium]UUF16780.1 hypothetical protein NLJ00_11825 [Flavobacterium panici]
MKKIAFFILILLCACNKEKAKETTKEAPKQIPEEASYFKDIKTNDVKLPKPTYGD